MTGARVFRAAKYLKGDDEDFFLTYGDAVADMDVDALLAAHRSHGKALTVSAVHPAGRFGEMNVEDGVVTGFAEKPQMQKCYINGGFMVLRREFVADYLADTPSLTFEMEPMRDAVAAGEMRAYPHNGFWQCMDNHREHQLLNALWSGASAPWTKYWK
jgi:glucose-1-phosphate cytidylyltransferase